MDQADYVINVSSNEDTESILRRLEQFPSGSKVALNVPRDTRTMGKLEDFTALRDFMRQHNLKLVVVSPEPTIVSLAKIYGLEDKSAPPATERKVINFADTEEDDSVLPRWPVNRTPATPDVVAAAPLDTPITYAPADTVAAAANQGYSIPEPAAPEDANWNDVNATPVPATPPIAQPQLNADDFTPAPTQQPNTKPNAEPEYLFGEQVALDNNAAHILGENTPMPDVQVNVPNRPTIGDWDETNAPEYDGAYGSSSSPSPTQSSRSGLGGLFGMRNPRRNRQPAPSSRGWANTAQAIGAGTLVAMPEGSLAIESTSGGVVASSAVPSVGLPVVTGTPRSFYPDVLVRQRNSRSVATSRSNSWVPVALILALLLFLLGFWAFTTFIPSLTTADVKLATVQSQQLGPIQVSVPVALGGAGDGSVMSTAPGAATPEPSGGILSTGPKTAPVVAAQLVQQPISVEGVIDTTGARQVPDHSARGTIELTNTSSDAIGIAANTQIGSANGKNFVTDAAITVPATDFYSHKFGIIRVDFVATEAGPDSNGISLSGSYGAAIFSTVAQSAGGDTRTIKQVSDNDVKQLMDNLRGQIAGEAQQQLLGIVPAGQVPITTTLSIPDDSWKPEYDHAVGEDADQLHLKLTATPQMYAYSSSQVDSAINTALTGGIVTQGMPVDTQVDGSTVTHDTITASGDASNGTLIYTTNATVQVDYNITPDQLAEIKQIVAGKTPADATTDLMNSKYSPYIHQVVITPHNPVFNLYTDKVPADTSHIDITPNSGATTDQTTGAAEPK